VRLGKLSATFRRISPSVPISILHDFALRLRRSSTCIETSWSSISGRRVEPHASTWQLKKVGDRPELLGREARFSSPTGHIAQRTTTPHLARPSNRSYHNLKALISTQYVSTHSHTVDDHPLSDSVRVQFLHKSVQTHTPESICRAWSTLMYSLQ
jgi:hypothetical protein